jgi:hypothetical protein
MENELSNSAVIKNAFELLSDFFNVLSDGYNPAIIDLQVSIDKRIVEKDIFVLPNHYGNKDNNRFFDKIISTKRDISQLHKRLDENFQWCLEHLLSFSKVPSLFESKFHLENFNKLVNKVKNQLNDFIETWDYKANEYVIDTNDGSLRRIIILQGDNRTIVIDFGNFIH